MTGLLSCLRTKQILRRKGAAGLGPSLSRGLTVGELSAREPQWAKPGQSGNLVKALVVSASGKFARGKLARGELVRGELARKEFARGKLARDMENVP